jgi:hypothetical protein
MPGDESPEPDAIDDLFDRSDWPPTRHQPQERSDRSPSQEKNAWQGYKPEDIRNRVFNTLFEAIQNYYPDARVRVNDGEEIEVRVGDEGVVIRFSDPSQSPSDCLCASLGYGNARKTEPGPHHDDRCPLYELPDYGVFGPDE